MTKKAIVIGATGLVGRAIVQQLVNTDYIGKVITLTRRSSPHSSTKVLNQVVDFDQLDNYLSLFDGDFLFSCLGTTVKQAGSINGQRKVDLEYQFKAAELAAKNGVSHYLLVSSTGANGQSNNSYLKMKGELEHRVSQLIFKRISIFQPSLLLGERTQIRLGEKMGCWIMPIICIIPFLRRFRPITGEQVAAKMVSISQREGASREFYRLDEIFIK
ncbi:NAD-dependent epimerase/dehydratase family protein [Colwellia sp. Bg11-12]|uniref:NAD-dependent epimerase/dehydratase family protein n=1 Tax=Colwellia sp. Bg11-12 TaxID=2759817 RepID=UPI0015F6B7BD|nr:NAD-dependent epimerase/dehydratase family protein [Colwellia sp. Bg11-12]MBA6262137.1 NAD-dependent epimerase/dehydratase family protein [Colwellia sp. Bg11-12]